MRSILAALGAASAAIALFLLRWPLSPIELALYDGNFRWFWAEKSAPREIVIVSIDSPSLEALGRFPWPRARHAAPVLVAVLLSFAASVFQRRAFSDRIVQC